MSVAHVNVSSRPRFADKEVQWDLSVLDVEPAATLKNAEGVQCDLCNDRIKELEVQIERLRRERATARVDVMMARATLKNERRSDDLLLKKRKKK